VDQARSRRGLIVRGMARKGSCPGALFVGALGMCLSGLAGAQSLPPFQVQTGSDGTVYIKESLSDMLKRLNTTSTPGTTPRGPGMDFRAPGGLPMPNGTTAPGGFKRGVAAKDIGRLFWRAAKSPWTAAAAGIAAAAWCKWETGNFLCDPMQPQQNQTGWGPWFKFTNGGGVNGLNSDWGLDAVVLCRQYASHGFFGGAPARGVLTNNGQTCKVEQQVADPFTIPGTTLYTWLDAGNPGTLALMPPGLYCPPVPNTTDPRYAIPGGPPDATGRCPTGGYGTVTEQEAGDRMEPHLSPSNIPGVVREAADHSAPELDGIQSPGTADGPATAPGPAKTTTTQAPGQAPQVTTQTTTYEITYYGDTYNVTQTDVTYSPDGSTRTDQAPVEFKTCGLPGQPACKIDETGTKPWVQPAEPFTDLKADDAAARAAAEASIVGPTWGWLEVPPLATCEPFEFPNEMGTLDPCGVVTTARDVMAYLWALAGVWLCLGMVRKTVTGGG
jgi:hypothetical protein